MNLPKRDIKHIWHPLTQHKTDSPPIGIVKAKGAEFWDEEGNAYIDAIASWYTAMYGHANTTITKAMQLQMEQLDFVMFSGFTHEPAVRLSEKLIEILPSNQQKVFFNDNGSTAIEAAIKMAIQYHHNKGEKRDTLIAFENGFHGDTFGAMSASGISSYNGPFEDFLLKVIRIPVPQENNITEVLERLEDLLSLHSCAAFVFEPLVQGAAGMKFHSAKGLDALLEKCQSQKVLCIADEVMTGFGKTGTTFASNQLQFKPDIICLSKALTAGMFPLSITSCTQQIFDAFLSDDIAKGFFHAHTYSAHPVGCAAAIAAIDLLQSEAIQQAIVKIYKAHIVFSEILNRCSNVKNVRVKGVILAFELCKEMNRYGTSRSALYQAFLKKGVCLRPLGNTIYILPPYVISKKQLQKVYQSILEVLESL